MPKRIIFPEKGKVELCDFEVPAPAAEEVRVRCLYSLMSIGTETIILHQKYDADSHFARMFAFPQIKTGVQAVGEVEARGEQVRDLQVGDMVFMRAAHGSHQVLAAAACSKLPAALDLKSACWSGLAKTAFRAAWAARFNKDSAVLIIGAGPVGQMALRWAACAGVRTLAVVDVSGFRLQHARRGGADRLFENDIAAVLDDIRAINADQGPDIVIDSTGSAAVFKPALAAAARYGKVILLGDCGHPSQQSLSSDVMVKGLSIQATHDSHDRDGWTQAKVDARFFQEVLNGAFNLDELISHEFEPAQCRAAYEQAEQRREQTMGVLFNWTKDNF